MALSLFVSHHFLLYILAHLKVASSLLSTNFPQILLTEELFKLEKESTVEPPKTDSPYYGNLHNVDKSPRSRIV